MSDEKYHQSLLMGAAVVAGIVGTLSALMRPHRGTQGWTKQARDAASQVWDKGEAMNKNMLLGGIAGGLIGATTALLFAPKSGSELRDDIVHSFSHAEDVVRSAARKSTSATRSALRSAATHKKGASTKGHSHKQRGAENRGEKGSSSATKKGTSARRRTAASMPKPAVQAHSERAAGETTES